MGSSTHRSQSCNRKRYLMSLAIISLRAPVIAEIVIVILIWMQSKCPLASSSR